MTNRLRVVATAATAMLIVQTTTVHAVQVSVTPSASLRTVFDDNKRLVVSNSERTFGTELSIGAKIGFATEMQGLMLMPRLNFSRYNGDNQVDLDSDDQRLRATAFREGERYRAELKADLRRDTTRTSELEDSGRVQANKRRISTTVTPLWTYSLSERTSLGLQASATDVRFEDSATTGLTDYRDYSMGTRLTHQWDPTSEIGGTVTVARYEASAVEVRIDRLVAKVHYAHRFSETFQADVAFGLFRSQLRRGSRQSTANDSGPLFEFGAQKQFERTRVQGRYVRTVTPSSSGALRNRDRLNLDIVRNLTPELDGVLSFLANNSDEVDNDRSDVDYRQAQARLSWRFAPNWTLSSAYRYRRQERGTQSKAAVSNAVLVTLRFRGDKKILAQ